jgi:16S rRNA (guanine(966)-N(2))-methyltransferase RsmD
MRIIAGAFRGKKLLTPQGVVTRPTSDRVKEALFSILTSRIDFSNIRVLDICAGTGSLGIESISRGAGSCCFIEYNRSVLPILDKNLADTNCKSRSEVLSMDAVTALHRCTERGKHFDLAFFDPPYSSDLYQTVPDALASSTLLTTGSILVIECSVRSLLQESYGMLKSFDRREYGETALELFIVEEK